jgi:hypothetical protein
MYSMNYKYSDQGDPFGGSFTSQSSKNKKTKKRIPLFIILVIAILLIGAVLYTFLSSKNGDNLSSKNGDKDNIEKTQEEVILLLNSLSKISIIPNEEPVIFTISDADALIKEQQFFTNSQNGDTLLIFPKAMKAIIYSSSRNIIVNMGPVTSEEPIVPADTSGIQEQQQVPLEEQIQSQESEETTVE